MKRAVAAWIAVGWLGFAILPWYALDDGFFSFRWLAAYFGEAAAPALFQGLSHGKPWLLPLIIPLLAPLAVRGLARGDPRRIRVLAASGLLGMLWLGAQGLAIAHRGWTLPGLEAVFGAIETRQFGMGYGAMLTFAAFLMLLCEALASRGFCKGDSFVTGSIGAIVALVVIFVFFPVFRVLIAAVQDNRGAFAPGLFVKKFFAGDIWGLDCLGASVSCGVAWNTLLLGVLVGIGTTLLGLAFALIVTRTGFAAKRALRVLTVLPIITPPFVIGLAVILLFGRAGAMTSFMDWAFDIAPSRWIYGLPGVWLAQMLAFTPIAFLVLIGVVEGISPSMEEAAQTLRADAWRTFATVSLPLMRPGLANAFLLGFIESLADFGNPLVLGGNFGVLSTTIFFAVVGAQHDQGRAAVLSIILLAFTLAAFYLQRRWLGRKSYATVTGKGDSGVHPPLPGRLAALCYGTAIPWALFTAIIYAMILFGGFVENFGRDHSFSLKHYVAAFAIDQTAFGLQWKGAAWQSFFTTVQVSAISAPLTAAIGLATAYLLVRQRFAGQNIFEFGTMLSFAIPGTVIGISYILAFNVPPVELTGTGVILVICFVFRNMPVGVRAGIASMTQIDKSLDEASLTLGARSFTTVRKVILPLLRPAIVAALVFSFVRAMTAVSAVIFLVSANYNMATSYIVGRVENGDYGLSIAYSSVLIVFMLAAVGLIQLVVGKRHLGRRAPALTLEGAPG